MRLTYRPGYSYQLQDLHTPHTPSGGLLDGACGYGRLAEDQWCGHLSLLCSIDSQAGLSLMQTRS